MCSLLLMFFQISVILMKGTRLKQPGRIKKGGCEEDMEIRRPRGRREDDGGVEGGVCDGGCPRPKGV